MAEYRVWLTVRGGMGVPSYEGKVDVRADDWRDAEVEAIRRAREAHGRWRDCVVNRIERQENGG